MAKNISPKPCNNKLVASSLRSRPFLVAFSNFFEREMLETTLRGTWMTCETIALLDIGGEFMKSLVKEEFSIFVDLKMSWDMNLLTYVKILCNKCVLSSMYNLWRMYLVFTIHNLWHFLPHQWNENRFPTIVLTWSCRTTPDVDFQQLTRHLQDHHESKVISIIFLTKPILPLFLLLRRM